MLEENEEVEEIQEFKKDESLLNEKLKDLEKEQRSLLEEYGKKLKEVILGKLRSKI